MKNRTKVLVVLGLMIITLTSITFAAFLISKNQINDNKVLSGCFNTSFTENSASINMTKALPLTNEQGLNTNPYSFTISNTCSINADYTVLINIKANSFSENYISYNYSGNEVNILNTAQVNNNVPSGFAKSYILGSGTLKRGKSETINIRLWLNELANYQDMTNKTFEAEIQIVSRVSTNQQYGDFNVIAINVQDENDSDVYNEVSEVPKSGYVFNDTKSYCEVDGIRDSSITIAYSKGKLIFDNLKNNTSCSLYFDQQSLLIGRYYLFLTDGNTYKYDRDGTLLETKQTNGEFTIEYTAKYSIEVHGGGGGRAAITSIECKDSDGDYMDHYCGYNSCSYSSLYVNKVNGGGSGNIFYDQDLSEGDVYSVILGSAGNDGKNTINKQIKNSYGVNVSYRCGNSGEAGGNSSFGTYTVKGGAGGNASCTTCTLKPDINGEIGASNGNLASNDLGGSTIGNYGNSATDGAIILRITDV